MAWIEERFRTVKGKKTKEKLYFVYDRVNGKKIGRPAGPIYEDARDIKRGMESESVRSDNGLACPSIKFAYDEYAILIQKSRAPGTWSAYDWALRKLLDFVTPGRNLKDIGKQDLIKFRNLVLQGHCVNGVLDIIKIVRTFFSYCIDSGYILTNPAQGLSKGIKEVDVAVYLTDDQIRHIVDCIDNPNHMEIRRNHADSKNEFADIVRVALLTGMREGDICSFKASFIIGDLIYIKGKGKKNRAIPINTKLRPILDKYIKRGTEFIFQGWNGRRIKSRWSRLYNRAKRANAAMPKRCRFHDLRHTFASNYLRGGEGLADLRIILGHSNIKTTVRYAHFEESDLVAKMENVKSGFLDPILKVV